MEAVERREHFLAAKTKLMVAGSPEVLWAAVDEKTRSRLAEGRTQVSQEQVLQSISFMKRVASRTTDDQWVEFMESGQLPPMELDTADLDHVVGGDGGATATVIVGVGAIVVIGSGYVGEQIGYHKMI